MAGRRGGCTWRWGGDPGTPLLGFGMAFSGLTPAAGRCTKSPSSSLYFLNETNSRNIGTFEGFAFYEIFLLFQPVCQPASLPAASPTKNDLLLFTCAYYCRTCVLLISEQCWIDNYCWTMDTPNELDRVHLHSPVAVLFQIVNYFQIW